MSDDKQRLDHFSEIARCPVMVRCLDSRSPTGACAEIVLWQWRFHTSDDRMEHWQDFHQLPEPWLGHLDLAPILFVGPNPSIRGEVPPDPASAEAPAHRVTWRWTDQERFARFERAFDDHIIGGTHELGAKKATRYWSSAKARAQELVISRPIRPGLDYALTEVARCKSPSLDGADTAVTECALRYLRKTIEMSPAVVLVAFGVHARVAFKRLFALRGGDEVEEVSFAGRQRLVVSLPHPNERGSLKSFADNVSEDGLRRLQLRLTEELG